MNKNLIRVKIIHLWGLIFAATSSLAGNLNLSYYTWTGMKEGGNLVLRGASIDPGGGDFPPNKRGGGLEPDRSFTRLLCKADQHSLYLYIKVLQHWRLQGYLHLPFFFSPSFFSFFPSSLLCQPRSVAFLLNSSA